ncbi:hypothetical protein M406DRAFT_294951 [Cryphonectria parasitica EP155]|uniref:Formin GTPase-binding domain-containing protein n=1 Tax=Cryphonectria parasitica (strain ATCC 38755 / EP155) TaxID=660469 RepID=A0A9P4XV35_CRYP1|nr:uncharacterized protein M406DRAFT_294951 [Cryphonectria parasitica EP155]KAF3761382.1 hypothetical protein M406DRAFT_294951 [Cryphonectria parasitica EP155]
MACPRLQLETHALGQWQQTGPVAIDSPRSPTKALRDDPNSHNVDSNPSRASSKPNLTTLSARFSNNSSPSKDKPPATKDNNQDKTNKARSSTNLKGLLLSRPKSDKTIDLSLEKESQRGKNKENRKPSDPNSPAITPIYAQFCKGSSLGSAVSVPSSPFDMPADPFTQAGLLNLHSSFRPAAASNGTSGPKQRPKSFQPQHIPKSDTAGVEQQQRVTRGRLKTDDEHAEGQKSSTWAKTRSGSRARVISALSNLGGQKSKSSSPTPEPESSEPQIDPKDVDRHLEAMLDRRNIPENQRYKMRNLNSTIKMEFIRQDWAEADAKKLGRRPTNESDDSAVAVGQTSVRGDAGADKRHTRGRSFTFSRNSWKIGASPSKGKKKDAPAKGHSRNKSTDSVIMDRPPSAGSHAGSGIIAKVTGQQPSDFVNYLRKVQKPEAVEVGKLHKLRLLLRNERVAWTEDFIKQGGMKEIVGLLRRIMDVEWREEHEDALLHEDLLCLKALCTTALALQYLHEIQDTLLPALIHLIFDPERKGPSEFTTRNIITSVLLTYIQSSAEQERVARAQTVLSYLRDPAPKEEERPVEFVLEMRRERPYRVWNKEVVSVTKEVFWIFLHHLNVVALPAGRDRSWADDKYAYMHRHFPQERPPVPAAPYVGGVEWDATNYLASHLDLLNAIIACTPTQAERNSLREQFRMSGWERCLGGSLRLCKEKFYPGVHDALRTWVAAAADDGWNVRDVRFGPPQESRSASPKKAAAAGASPKKEPPPRLEMPKLDFVLDGPLSAAP